MAEPRRSTRIRKPKSEILEEEMKGIKAKLIANDESDLGLGLEIAHIENKGRGIRVCFSSLIL